MSENKKNVPKRRFREFENAEAWEQRKLKDILSLENGFAFKSKFFQEENSTTIVLTPGNVAIGGGFQNDKGRYYNAEGIFPRNFIFNPGDIFVTMTDLTPSAQTLGFPAIVPNDEIEYLHNQRLGKIINYDSNNLFLFYLLCTVNYHNYIVSTASGTTVKHTSPERILDYNCYIPKKNEQSKIGSCFRQLDKLISAQQRKLEKMKALKNAYLTEMFPAEGERKPKLRFAGFTDDWEQWKLGNIVDIRSGRDYKHLSEGKIPVYGTGGYMLSVNEALSYKEDAIGIGRKGTIDKPYILRAPFWTVDTLFYAIPETNNDLDFIYNIFQNINWKQKDESTGVPSLSKTAINDIDVLIPEYKEQKQIGNFFQNIDNLITLYQHKLDKLQNIKKAYLKEMFI